MMSRYIVFVIYDDKSHYPSTYNMLWKKQSYVRRIYFREDLKNGLIYHFNTTNVT